MSDSIVGFIGFGLIGGSIARGLKRADPNTRIMAYMRTRSKLEQAHREGIVDVILEGVGEPLRDVTLFSCALLWNTMPSICLISAHI